MFDLKLLDDRFAEAIKLGSFNVAVAVIVGAVALGVGPGTEVFATAFLCGLFAINAAVLIKDKGERKKILDSLPKQGHQGIY